MNTMTLQLCRAALVATAFATTSLAVAGGPSPASIEMQVALAKAEQGPDELRRYVHRTRMIHALDYIDVMRVHEAKKAASALPVTPAAIASAPAAAPPTGNVSAR